MKGFEVAKQRAWSGSSGGAIWWSSGYKSLQGEERKNEAKLALPILKSLHCQVSIQGIRESLRVEGRKI